VKEKCLSKLILFGERSLRRALTQYVAHFRAARHHQRQRLAVSIGCCPASYENYPMSRQAPRTPPVLPSSSGVISRESRTNILTVRDCDMDDKQNREGESSVRAESTWPLNTTNVPLMLRSRSRDHYRGSSVALPATTRKSCNTFIRAKSRLMAIAPH
jgi:hypothetical protein